jgi:predicted amidohydrolase YtcJ
MNLKIFHGGQIITMDDTLPECESIVVGKDKILATGDFSKLDRQFPGAEKIDLKGQYLLPGFIDAHSHILWAAKTRGEPVVDIRAITEPTFEKVLAKIQRRMKHAKNGECLVFFGLDAQLHPDMIEPDKAMLDAIAPDNPIAIQTSNCHAVYLNSAALELCQLNRNTPDKPGGIIIRDGSGMPTGKVMEATTWDVLDIFYEVWGQIRLDKELKNSADKFLQEGITTVTEHLYLPYYKAYYLSALIQGHVLPRIAVYQQATDPDMKVDKIENLPNQIWMAGVKMHADGSPFIGNIWLSEPYLESEITIERMHLKPGHTGSINYSEDYLRNMIESYVAQGWPMTVHTQGDRTIDMVLDIIDDMVMSKKLPQDHRFRLEHCALMKSEQIDRAIQLGVICSYFINHIKYWGEVVEDHLFGAERAAHYMPAGSACERGMRISLHADTPMTDASALVMMQTAVTRKTLNGRVIGLIERLTVEQALRAVTIDAAYQLFMEDSIGSIRENKLADFVVLDKNPLDVPVNELENIRISETWLAGQKVYSSESTV